MSNGELGLEFELIIIYIFICIINTLKSFSCSIARPCCLFPTLPLSSSLSYQETSIHHRVGTVPE